MSGEDGGGSPSSPALAGCRLLVVGATSGIGRALAQAALARGATVVGAGRRRDRLAELETRGVLTATVDVADRSACAALGAEVRERVGTLEAVVDCAGAASLRRLTELARSDWDEVLGSGPIGANNLIAELIPVLSPTAVLAFLSSDSVPSPPYALGAYAAAKAALEALLHGWRGERPDLRFCTFALGPTFPTDFGVGFAPGAVEEAIEHWNRTGFAWDRISETEAVSALLLDVLVSLLEHPSLSVEHLLVRSPGARAGAAAGG